MITKFSQPELTPNATLVLEQRYLLRDKNGKLLETELQLFQRVARHVASAEEAYEGDSRKIGDLFLKAMLSLDFLPNSPTLMNAGTRLNQLAACFVLPIEDTVDSVFNAVGHSARIQGSGGGVGFSFSKIRPKGDVVRSTGGIAAGPVSFLRIFDAATECIKQSGRRRGANMGVLRIDHPDIEEFIQSKEDPTELTNFNLSVGVTDNFMQTLAREGTFNLINPRTKEVANTITAQDLFDKIVAMAWATGDPGMIFLDRVNQGHSTPHLGVIEATNPCGETPLLPYESCVLGSVNLSHMVVNGQVDWSKLAETVRLGVRFLDNVIDVNSYPLPEIKKMTLAGRKVGLGVMGWADALIKLQIPYDSEQGVTAAEEIMGFISFHARSASIQLARERGRFPEFEGSKYDRDPRCIVHEENQSKTVLQERPELDWRVPVDQLREYGIRNATVTTIAPTGSISTIAGASSGIEPLFALAYVRRILNQEIHEINSLFQETMERSGYDSPAIMQEVVKQGNTNGIKAIPEHIHRLFVTAHEIDPEWHVRMQAAFQHYVDNAVSKTVNLRKSATKKDVANIYLIAYELGCKGVTIYRDGSRKHQVLLGGIQEDDQFVPRPRPVPDGMLPARSYSLITPTGKMTLFVREIGNKPFDTFVVLGRSGSDITAFTEAIGRLLSIALRSNIPVDILAENLVGLGGRTSVGFGPSRVLSVPDAIGKILQEAYCSLPESRRRGEICPDCKNASLEYTEGCLKCPLCGFAEC
jgi:ribonucleoside-diphosphate reductase alpha chain